MYMFFRKVVAIFIRIKYRLYISGKENVPADSKRGGFIIACNHQTYWDCPIIATVVRSKFSFIAKAELFAKKDFFAFVIKRCGAFPIDRGAGDSAPIEKSVADLKNGRAFVIFPEGKRSVNGELGRAKSGVALIAGMAGAPILPICIMYGERRRFRRVVRVAVGKMIPAGEVSVSGDGDRTQLRRASTRIMDEIRALQSQIVANADIPFPTTHNNITGEPNTKQPQLTIKDNE